MSRIIKVCALCGSGKIYRRHRIEGERYHCDACKQNFSIPVLKESKVELKNKKVPAILQKYLT